LAATTSSAPSSATAGSSLRSGVSASPGGLYANNPSGIEIPPGRWSLQDFFTKPDAEFAAGWTIGLDRCGQGKPACGNQGSRGGLGYGYDLVQLTTTDRPQSQLILFHPTELLTDPCALTPPPTIRPDDSFLEWMRAQSSLSLGEPVPRVFTYVRATQMDVAVVDANACPYSSPRYVVMNTYGASSQFFELQSGMSIRAFAMTLPKDVIAFVIAPTQEEFDLLIPKAEDVLKSIHFPSP
jgi:hypothetical protein